MREPSRSQADVRPAAAPRERLLLARVEAGAGRTRPYARLIDDAMNGDPTLFATWQAIEAQWSIVDPIGADTPPSEYEPGTWGPAEVERLLLPAHRRRNPQAPPPPATEPAHAPSLVDQRL